ncbi:hypothetical protein M9Y10_018303 [Tritrichomonas musculus]|uniref:Uncharacterized protein n=1 Tax=Tritrichomonas musculus TaxID=1915356 RepID=A0ABR2HN81_9EUKA
MEELEERKMYYEFERSSNLYIFYQLMNGKLVEDCTYIPSMHDKARNYIENRKTPELNRGCRYIVNGNIYELCQRGALKYISPYAAPKPDQTKELELKDKEISLLKRENEMIKRENEMLKKQLSEVTNQKNDLENQLNALKGK